MTRVKFAPLAEEEAADAAEWYESRGTGLGEEFLSAIAAVAERLKHLPMSGPLVEAIRSRVPVRRLLVPGFPYAVCYAVFASHVQVLAVAHTRRMPGYWIARIPPKSRRMSRREGE